MSEEKQNNVNPEWEKALEEVLNQIKNFNWIEDQHRIEGVIANILCSKNKKIQQLKQQLGESEERTKRLEESAMRNVRSLAKRKKQPNWVLYRDLFATGATTAFERCQQIGLDPDKETN